MATGDDPVTIVIGESGGHASIGTTDAKGRFWDMVFTPTKMVFRASGWKKSVSASMWRAGEAPFTGTYRAELPYGPLTVRVAYGDRVLVLSGSRIWFSGELIGDWRESFSSKDGITLTHYETGLPHETMLYTHKAENQTAATF